MEQQEIDKFREQLAQLTESLQGAAGAAQKADATISDELGKKFPNAAKPTMAALSGLGNAVTDVTAALYRGERGMNVMAKGIDTMVDGIQAAAAIFTTFTPFGKALSLTSKILINGAPLVAKAFSSYNKLSAEQSDKLYNVYQKLSDIGATGNGGLEKFMDNLQQAGFSIAELDQFASVIQKNAADLTKFGATAGMGAENLAKMSGSILKSDLGESLQMLGYTAESLAQSTSNYLALQNQLGRVQLKTQAELQQGAGQYALELDKLTRLTGLSREEAEKRQRSLISDERYAGFMATEARAQGYNTENLSNFFSMISDESTRKGLQHLMASGGTATSEESRRVMQTDPRAYERMMRVARGSGYAQEAAGFYGAAGQYMQGTGGQLARFGATGPGIAVASNLESAETMQQMTAAATKAGMSLDSFAETEQGKAILNKGALKDQVKLRREQLGVAQQLDSTAKGLTSLQSATNSLSSAFASLAGKILPTPAGGTPSTTGAGRGAGANVSLEQIKQQLAAQGITDTRATSNILANIQAESGFNARSEDLNYSGQKLFEMFGAGNKAGNKARFNSIAEANALAAQGPEAIGNAIYGGRMGNAANEGFKYRGRGLIQLTGKSNYEKYGKMIGVDLVKDPDLANDPAIAAKLAAAYFADKQRSGTNLGNISDVGAAVGYAGGAAETARRAELAQRYMQGNVPQVSQPTSNNQVSGAFGWNGSMTGPMSGYRPNLLMHGTEELSIRPMGRGSSSSTEDGNVGTMELLSQVRDLVSIGRQQLAVNQKILKYQQ